MCCSHRSCETEYAAQVSGVSVGTATPTPGTPSSPAAPATLGPRSPMVATALRRRAEVSALPLGSPPSALQPRPGRLDRRRYCVTHGVTGRRG